MDKANENRELKKAEIKQLYSSIPEEQALAFKKTMIETKTYETQRIISISNQKGKKNYPVVIKLFFIKISF